MTVEELTRVKNMPSYEKEVSIMTMWIGLLIIGMLIHLADRL